MDRNIPKGYLGFLRGSVGFFRVPQGFIGYLGLLAFLGVCCMGSLRFLEVFYGSLRFLRDSKNSIELVS